MQRHRQLALLCIAGALTLWGSLRTESMQAQPGLFAERWNSGLDPDEPGFQVQAVDAATFAIRQSIRTSPEAPFLYLLIGSDIALLIDTGGPDTDHGTALGQELDRVLAARDLPPHLRLVVMHTHGHGDHTGADQTLASRPNTTVVGHAVDEVRAFFGIERWPAQTVPFELGGRTVDVIPTPGHHPSHVTIYDRRTRILFTGDAVYPGILRFQCDRAGEYLDSIGRLGEFADQHQARWLLGGHVEMRATPGRYFGSADRVRHDEHVLELPPAVLVDIAGALGTMVDRPRVAAHDQFVLFPYPADMQGKQPPNWCGT